MSDHNAPDPIDQTYVQADAMLDDEAARAARRARVLGAVAAQGAQTRPAEAERVRPRSAWGRGGWLMAASVAGIGAILAVQLSPTREIQPRAPSNEAAPSLVDGTASAPAADLPRPVIKAAPAPMTALAPAAPTSPPPAPQAAGRAEMSSADDIALTAQREAPPAAPAPAPASPPPVAFPASQTDSDTIVTGARATLPPAAARSAMSAESAAAPAPAALGARLRAAAAAGRTAELSTLLGQGAAVDAADARGETALMKSVQANQPAAAALLRRYGASLDLRNRAGLSARDMAASLDDPELDQALEIRRR